jgi:hypothetical protein
MSKPEERGFYYIIECQLLLSQDHAVAVPRSTLTTNIEPPPGWEKKKTRTGSIKADISPPSQVWEVDLDSFAEYRETFNPRGGPERPNDTSLTIAEVAERFGFSRAEVHQMVYEGNIPHVEFGEFEISRFTYPFRFVQFDELREWLRSRLLGTGQPAAES